MIKPFTLCMVAFGALAAPVYGELHAPAATGLAADLEQDQLLAEIETTSARQTQLEQEEIQLGTRRQALHDDLKQRINALYRLTRNGMAPVTGGFDAVRSHVARVRRMRALVEHDVKAWDELQAHTKANRSESELTTATLRHARERLNALQPQASAAESEPDTAALPVTREPVARIEVPQERAHYGLRVVNADAPRSGFLAQRGKLPAPVSGEVRVTDGRPSPGEGASLLFEATLGTAVRAVASGRVAFSDNSAAHGRMVILDHGDGYASVYAQLGSIEVRVGDTVSASARLGDIGPSTRAPALMFQLRHGTRVLPPRTWLGL